MSGDKLFGPYVHGLNKGGLAEIVRTGSLRASTASNHLANERAAVRAYVGTFEHQKRNKNWSGVDKTFIEFFTNIAPRPGLPPGYAEWTEEQLVGKELAIRITKIVNGDGVAVQPAAYSTR